MYVVRRVVVVVVRLADHYIHVDTTSKHKTKKTTTHNLKKKNETKI